MKDTEILERLWNMGYSGSVAQQMLNDWYVIEGIRGEAAMPVEPRIG